MAINLEWELEQTFREAVMSSASAVLKTPEDWRRVRAINERAEQRIQGLEQRYAEERQSRIEREYQRLVDEAGRLGLDHPAPMGHDRFDRNAISKKAQKTVSHDYERDLQTVRKEQTEEVLDFLETARKRILPHGKAREDFELVSDRRKGSDRRAPIRNR